MRLNSNAYPQTQSWLPCLLTVLLALPSVASPQAATQTTVVQDLQILPLAGNGATNDIERKIMSPLVVQVLDQQSRPIEGAQVIFHFPLNGPSAAFPNQQSSQTTRTNADGQAAATGWTANDLTGTFQVQVTATRGNEMGQASISMTNAARVSATGTQGKKKSWWSSKWAKIGVITGIAGVITAVVLVTHDSGNGNGTVITASPGSPTIGAPQ
jgi:hypothetical protein